MSHTSISFPSLSADERFIIKQMSKAEIQSFLEFGPRYFEYMRKVLTQPPGDGKVTQLCLITEISLQYPVGVNNSLSLKLVSSCLTHFG